MENIFDKDGNELNFGDVLYTFIKGKSVSLNIPIDDIAIGVDEFACSVDIIYLFDNSYDGYDLQIKESPFKFNKELFNNVH